jgi:hypothetical protein
MSSSLTTNEQIVFWTIFIFVIIFGIGCMFIIGIYTYTDFNHQPYHDPYHSKYYEEYSPHDNRHHTKHKAENY